MTRDELFKEINLLIDRAYEDGWDEGYRRGKEDADD